MPALPPYESCFQRVDQEFVLTRFAHISVSGGRKAFDSRFYPRKFADKNVEDRREKDAEKCHSQHPREDGCPERLTHLGTGSVAEHEWYYARDECEGGHQDRAQT